MTYEEAITDFDRLNEDDKVKEVYAHFGLAVYYAQVLEQQSINMIAANKQCEGNIIDEKGVEALWDEYDLGSRTFGKLIFELKSLYNFSEEDQRELKVVLKLRNYIAHNYFRINAELFYSNSGQKRMIKDFIEFQQKAGNLDKKLIKYLRVYTDKIGLTQEQIEKIMEQTKKTWSEKIVNEDYVTITK